MLDCCTVEKADGYNNKNMVGAVPAIAGLPQIPQQQQGGVRTDTAAGAAPLAASGDFHHQMAQITPMQPGGQIAPSTGPAPVDAHHAVVSSKPSKNLDVVDYVDPNTNGMGNGGLKARWGDANHPQTEVATLDNAVDEREFSFFNDLTRQFVKSAIIGGECHLVSLKTGQNKLAIYQVDKNLENFFLIDQESGKSDLWGLSGIEVRPAPNKWSLSVRSADELSKMVLVKYSHPDLLPVTPLVVVALKSKNERDLFYCGMKILRLYAAHKSPRGGNPGTALPTMAHPAPDTNLFHGNEPPADHVLGGK